MDRPTPRRARALVLTVAVIALLLPTMPSTAQNDGNLLVGAAKISIEPRPDDYGGVWETEGCATLGDDALAGVEHVPDFRFSWNENSNCIYMGGYGIGPMNPITSWDTEYGLWVRTLAMSNGEQIVVLSVIDGAYYIGDLNNMCETCGALVLAETLAEEHDGLAPEGFLLQATHSHTSPDFIGAWGGIPNWYFQQVEDAIRGSVADAIEGLRPAEIEFGEQLARPFNRERRNYYRSAESETLAWLRAKDVASGETIATLGNYAGHPTSMDESTGMAHADWPGAFEKRVEERFGGVGLLFNSGIGNMSFSGSLEGGVGLADAIPDPGVSPRFASASIGAARDQWTQPWTNAGLGVLAEAQFFDRPLEEGLFESFVQKHDEARPCVSVSTIGVATQVSAFHVGPLVFTAGPGELFSNITNTFREKSPGAVTFTNSIANDGLGYLIQSFEFDRGAQQGVGFAGTDLFEYEDAYGLDPCFGDEVVERTLALMAGFEVDPAPARPAPGTGGVGGEGTKPTPVTGGGVAVLVLATAALFAMGRAKR
ncbi:MAG: hypothetical protein R3249_02715 [Nitriliruptorales bacterium]|nr:hypothetical protein [Nitriliruptorales bacterium]